MREAIREYVEREEARERFKQEALVLTVAHLTIQTIHKASAGLLQVVVSLQPHPGCKCRPEPAVCSRFLWSMDQNCLANRDGSIQDLTAPTYSMPT